MSKFKTKFLLFLIFLYYKFIIQSTVLYIKVLWERNCLIKYYKTQINKPQNNVGICVCFPYKS